MFRCGGQDCFAQGVASAFSASSVALSGGFRLGLQSATVEFHGRTVTFMTTQSVLFQRCALMCINFSAPHVRTKPASVTTMSADAKAIRSAMMLEFRERCWQTAAVDKADLLERLVTLGRRLAQQRAMAPAPPMSLALTGCPSVDVPTTFRRDDDEGRRSRLRGQNGHHFTGRCDVKRSSAVAVRGPPMPMAMERRARSFMSMTRGQEMRGVEFCLVAVLDVVVNECREQVVAEVTACSPRQVEVDVLHWQTWA